MSVPVFKVKALTLGDAWERAVFSVFYNGFSIKTEYGGSSKDATVLVEVEYPLSEPHYSIGDYVTAIDIKSYVPKVLDGTLDDKIGEVGVSYTYHDRLFKYWSNKRIPINQIEMIIEALKKVPYSRRVQAITWDVYRDWKTDFPPCLQRIWCRVYNGELIMQTEWRSRDLFHAWGSNAYAMVELQKLMAKEIGVGVGKYVDFSNSLHIYEKDYKEVENFIETFEIKKNKPLNLNKIFL